LCCRRVNCNELVDICTLLCHTRPLWYTNGIRDWLRSVLSRILSRCIIVHTNNYDDDNNNKHVVDDNNKDGADDDDNNNSNNNNTSMMIITTTTVMMIATIMYVILWNSTKIFPFFESDTTDSTRLLQHHGSPKNGYDRYLPTTRVI